MKTLLLAAIAFVSLGLGSCKNEKSIEDKLLGQWCNPFTYQSTGELKGFEFKKNGECAAIGIPSLQLKTWEVDAEGYLIIKGTSEEEDGRIEPYETRERIGKLNPDSLELLISDNPRMGFLYLNTKIIKDRVTPQVAEDKVQE